MKTTAQKSYGAVENCRTLSHINDIQKVRAETTPDSIVKTRLLPAPTRSSP